jgi:glycosyltransferase involved in cell wall biosynthesis
MSASPDATVVITTKDRREELRTAVESALRQEGADIEVLVIDDGSSDGTANMLQADYPSARLWREEQSKGLIVRRNQGAHLANGEVIFSIDDDAEFTTPYVVRQTLDDFEESCIGAVAIPYMDVNRDSEVRQQAPDDRAVYCTAAYRGTAHAVRRDLFLELGGYREHFVHQGEERDLCVRMLGAGYVVRLGRADHIRHYESPRRSFERMDFYGRRNDILFAWHNAPTSLLPFYLALETLNTVRTALRHRRFRSFIRGLLAGYRDCIRYAGKRAPLDFDVFRLYRTLFRKGPLPLEEVRTRLRGFS